MNAREKRRLQRSKVLTEKVKKKQIKKLKSEIAKLQQKLVYISGDEKYRMNKIKAVYNFSRPEDLLRAKQDLKIKIKYFTNRQKKTDGDTQFLYGNEPWEKQFSYEEKRLLKSIKKASGYTKGDDMVVCEYCGKEFSKSGIRLHKKYCTSSTPKKDEQEINSGEYSSSTPKQSTSKYSEVSMKEQYDEKKTQIEPKKEQEKEQEFECGSCGAQFNKRHKFCPECGIGFEE